MEEFHRDEASPEVLDDLLARIAEALASADGLIAAVLYGSAAEGLPFRDLDIALVVDRRVWPAGEDWDRENRLADQVASISPFPVDVRVVNDAPPGFRYHVTRGRPLLIRDEEAYADFVERTWDVYFDFAPFARRYFEELVR
ncbi:MAG: nucleotidyltransferase domain-containing protein [Anaerolineae bacterium]